MMFNMHARLRDVTIVCSTPTGCPKHFKQTTCSTMQMQAFGNAVNPVFTLSLPEPRGWRIVTMQILLVAQSCINYQLWARPT
jgi:hypothetical protein